MVRFKIENVPFAKFTLQNNGYDFILSYPNVHMNGNEIKSHFTLHTGREMDRITFKVPSISINGKESIDIVRKMYSERKDYASCVTKTDIDLGGPKFVNYNTSNKNVSNLMFMAFNLEGYNRIPFFDKTKTKDTKFKYVWNIEFPSNNRRRFKLEWIVGRNLNQAIIDKKSSDQWLIVEEPNKGGILYTHFFGVSFNVQEMKD